MEATVSGNQNWRGASYVVLAAVLFALLLSTLTLPWTWQ